MGYCSPQVPLEAAPTDRPCQHGPPTPCRTPIPPGGLLGCSREVAGEGTALPFSLCLPPACSLGLLARRLSKQRQGREIGHIQPKLIFVQVLDEVGTAGDGQIRKPHRRRCRMCGDLGKNARESAPRKSAFAISCHKQQATSKKQHATSNNQKANSKKQLTKRTKQNAIQQNRFFTAA